MAEPLPKLNIPIYSEDELKPMCEAERHAARCGIETKYLKFATPEFTSEPDEQYRLHNYSKLHVRSSHTEMVVTCDEQFRNALTLLDSGMLWCKPPGLIVINSPYFVFDDPDPFKGADGFLAHLICSLSHRVQTKKVFKMSGVTSINVNFFGNTFLDRKDYQTIAQHLLIWGPVTDLASDHDCAKTIQFLFSYREHTRILLTSTKDVGALLERLRINALYVSAFFNFDADKDGILIPDPPKKKKKGTPRKATPKKVLKQLD